MSVYEEHYMDNESKELIHTHHSIHSIATDNMLLQKGDNEEYKMNVGPFLLQGIVEEYKNFDELKGVDKEPISFSLKLRILMESLEAIINIVVHVFIIKITKCNVL